MKEITIKVSDKTYQDILAMQLRFDLSSPKEFVEHTVYLFLGQNTEKRLTDY